MVPRVQLEQRVWPESPVEQVQRDCKVIREQLVRRVTLERQVSQEIWVNLVELEHPEQLDRRASSVLLGPWVREVVLVQLEL